MNSTHTAVFLSLTHHLFLLPGERNEARRHTAILVLRELATNAPTLFYPHVPQRFLSFLTHKPRISFFRGAQRGAQAHGHSRAARASHQRPYSVLPARAPVLRRHLLRRQGSQGMYSALLNLR